MDDYSDYDGLGLAELVAKKKVTPAELVEAAIERIERHNPTLNAVVYKGYDDARKAAAGPMDRRTRQELKIIGTGTSKFDASLPPWSFIIFF